MIESMIEAETLKQLKAHYLEAIVEAALQGHQLGEWRSLGDRNLQYQASCHQCGHVVYITTGLVFSELSPHCDPYPFAD
jgi:hypothetical protein